MKPFALVLVGAVVGGAVLAHALGPYVPPGMTDPTTGLVNQGVPAAGSSSEFSLVGRYQVSSYGTPSSNGCYIIDTMTGRTWRAVSGQAPQLVGDLPQQQPIPTHTPQVYLPIPTPASQEPTTVNPTQPPVYDEPALTPPPKTDEPTPSPDK
jgi:hypothetical protein